MRQPEFLGLFPSFFSSFLNAISYLRSVDVDVNSSGRYVHIHSFAAVSIAVNINIHTARTRFHVDFAIAAINVHSRSGGSVIAPNEDSSEKASSNDRPSVHLHKRSP
jgi:hypothetical protein